MTTQREPQFGQDRRPVDCPRADCTACFLLVAGALVPDKLWHDDIRRPPSHDWFWARTNQEAVAWLLENACSEASLDHDLGMHGANPDAPDAWLSKGQSAETGVDFVKVMLLLRLVPARVTIHSWNPDGANYMAGLLQSLSGADVQIKPYEVPNG